MKKTKRVLSWILIICICFSILPIKVEARSRGEIQAKMIQILYAGQGGRLTCDFDGYANKTGRHEGIDFAFGAGRGVSRSGHRR
jgi:hypothetical protein